MSNAATLEMPEAAATTYTVIETGRGPVLSHRPRLTVYWIYEYLNKGYSHEQLQQSFELNAGELDAMLRYITDHQDEVAHDYAEIMRRNEELRAQYEPVYWACSSFTPDMTLAEKKAVLRRIYAEKFPDSLPQDEISRTA